jgi:hypothetical protein
MANDSICRDLKKGRHAKMPPPVSPTVVAHSVLPNQTTRSISPGPAKPPKSPKRRNTMNSRDAAYDETQVLQLSIPPEPEPEPEAPANPKRKRKRTGDVEEDDM